MENESIVVNETLNNETHESLKKENSKWILTLKKIAKQLLNYIIKTMNGMAYGLFATLIISVIFSTIGSLLINVDVSWIKTIGDKINALAIALKSLMGVGIGIGVAFSLKFDGIKLISISAAGGIATLVTKSDPIVAYLTIIAAAEGTRLILRKKTPIDIILIPLLTSLIALLVALLIGNPIASAMTAIGNFLTTATTLTNRLSFDKNKMKS